MATEVRINSSRAHYGYGDGEDVLTVEPPTHDDYGEVHFGAATLGYGPRDEVLNYLDRLVHDLQKVALRVAEWGE